METKKEVWIDYLRVIACLMVMIIHATEVFYFGNGGGLVLSRADAFWVSLFDAAARSCVPLFLVASSYLQFPLRYSVGQFAKRRALRILVPLVVWAVVYAIVSAEPGANLKSLLLNFNYGAGHLWFVYMLIGAYLIMPLLSPWAEKVSRKELTIYLSIWAFTSFIPYLRDWLSPSAAVILGPSGIPNPALYPLWGEASWNSNGVFYYLSGFVGYLLLGLYFKRFMGALSWKKTVLIAMPCFAIGLLISAGGFFRRIGPDFPAAVPLSTVVHWETTINFCSFGVMLMTIALLLIFKKFSRETSFSRTTLRSLSESGYGMYLIHMLILSPVAARLVGWLGRGEEGLLGAVWTTPVEIILIALVSFILSAIAAVLCRQIPRIGKWLMG